MKRNEELTKKADQVSKILKQLAHPSRLKVLCFLTEGEKTVNELVAYADASQSWVSQFLARMKSDGLIESEKKGIFVHYRIRETKLKALMEAIFKIYCSPSKI